MTPVYSLRFCIIRTLFYQEMVANIQERHCSLDVTNLMMMMMIFVIIKLGLAKNSTEFDAYASIFLNHVSSGHRLKI